MTQPQNNLPITPIHGDAKLYYRHAEGENLIIVGPESSPYKTNWVKDQIDVFTRLGWRFLVIDMSPLSVMGKPHIIGEHWTNIERQSIFNIIPPVVVRVPKFRNLLDTLDEVNLLKSENPSMKHITFVNLGEFRSLAPEEKDALYGSLFKLSTYHHGVWLSTERFQPFPMERLDMFQTQIVLSNEEETDSEMQKWINQFVEITESQIDEEEAYCLFNGKSEGAGGRLYICNVANRRDW